MVFKDSRTHYNHHVNIINLTQLENRNMAMKPLPKLIIIVAVVGGVGFGLTRIDFSSLVGKKPVAGADPAPVVTTVAPPPADAMPAPAPVAAPTQAPVAPTPRPTANDRGLDAVLGAGKK